MSPSHLHIQIPHPKPHLPHLQQLLLVIVVRALPAVSARNTLEQSDKRLRLLNVQDMVQASYGLVALQLFAEVAVTAGGI